ncbi:hypothetical protein ACH50O_21960 [Methylomonas sp. 2BW1-5-20]|uniref:hypothetical protein n=1 Tax=Methylomonas sp. 2BW1-5-20 TaxID=3376686 RepID=UPI00405070DD
MSERDIENHAILAEGSTQLFYADKIINFAMGPAVSKLTLGMESGPQAVTPTITLVLPTNSLLESLSIIQTTIHENANIKAELLKGATTLQEQFKAL